MPALMLPECTSAEIESGGKPRLTAGTAWRKEASAAGRQFSSAQSRRWRNGRSLHELPHMATDGEKLRPIHAAEDITDHGCQYPCRSREPEAG